MKTVKYVPSVCKGDNPTFSGFIELRLPTFDEKYEYLETSGISVGESGEINSGNTISQMAVIRKFVKQSAKHYQSVSLKKIATEEAFESFDDMQYDSDCHQILIEVATQLINGFKLGNG